METTDFCGTPYDFPAIFNLHIFIFTGFSRLLRTGKLSCQVGELNSISIGDLHVCFFFRMNISPFFGPERNKTKKRTVENGVSERFPLNRW